MNIVVLGGGTSTERDVSVTTSVNVCKALRKLGHNANIIDVFFGSDSFAYSREFFEDKTDPEIIAVKLKEKSSGIKEEIRRRKQTGEAFFGPFVLEVCKDADIVFMGLHGENGENGKIQATFDLLGIRYTGPGYLSSAMSMDKAITKKMLIPEGVPMPEGVTLERGANLPAKGLPLPCVVKPACGGSSVGVSICHTETERDEAIKSAFSLEGKILVEEYVKGREFSVGVCAGEALPVVEIIPNGGVYDYEHKYDPQGAEEICPADIARDVSDKMQEFAKKACEAAGITTYSRVDELMDDTGRIVCLEINTLPGMTPTSLLPKEAAAMGLSYEQLVQRLIDISLEKCNIETF